MRFKEGVPEKANTKSQKTLRNPVQPPELLAQGLYQLAPEGPQ